MMNNQSCLENKYEMAALSRASSGRCYIRCTHNKTSTSSTGKTNSTTHSRKAESSGEKCNFELLIKYDDEHNQWYLRKNAGHCLVHSGHIPIKREHNEQGKRNVSDDVLKDAETLLDKNVPRSVVKEIVHIKSKHKMSSASLSKLKQTMVVNTYKNGNEKESTADTLLRMMESDENIEYVAYFGSYSEAEKLVRVRKRRSKKKKKRNRNVMPSDATQQAEPDDERE